jgi:hypothetical protein
MRHGRLIDPGQLRPSGRGRTKGRSDIVKRVRSKPVALTHGADETESGPTAYLIARLQSNRVGSIDSAAAGDQAQAVPRGPSGNCERTS